MHVCAIQCLVFVVVDIFGCCCRYGCSLGVLCGGAGLISRSAAAAAAAATSIPSHPFFKIKKIKTQPFQHKNNNNTTKTQVFLFTMTFMSLSHLYRLYVVRATACIALPNKPPSDSGSTDSLLASHAQLPSKPTKTPPAPIHPHSFIKKNKNRTTWAGRWTSRARR